MPRHKHVLTPELATMDPGKLRGRHKGPWLHEALLNLILAMNPGDLFPSERVLAERYGVARLTVRRELTSLEDNGLLERSPGRGTFVRRPRGQVDTLTSFTDMRQWLHATAEIYSIRTRRATGREREQLELAAGDRVIHIHRLRISEGQPLAVERISLPAERFAGLTRQRLENRSLYRTLSEEFDAHAFTADQTITITHAEPEDAECLGIQPGDAVMRIERITLDNLGVAMDTSTAICHPEHYRFHVKIGLG